MVCYHLTEREHDGWLRQVNQAVKEVRRASAGPWQASRHFSRTATEVVLGDGGDLLERLIGEDLLGHAQVESVVASTLVGLRPNVRASCDPIVGQAPEVLKGCHAASIEVGVPFVQSGVESDEEEPDVVASSNGGWELPEALAAMALEPEPHASSAGERFLRELRLPSLQRPTVAVSSQLLSIQRPSLHVR